MANYKVGDLDVTISGVSKDAVSSLDEVIKQLDTLQGKLGIVGKGFSGAFKVNNAAIRSVVGDLGDIAQTTRNATDSQEKLNATIENGTSSAKELTDNYNAISTALVAVSQAQDHSLEVLNVYNQALEKMGGNAIAWRNIYASLNFSNAQLDVDKAYEKLNKLGTEFLRNKRIVEATNEAFKRMAMTEQELALYDFQQENASRKQRIAYLNLMLATGQAGDKTREYTQELKRLTKQQQIADKVAGKSATGGLSKLVKQIGRIALYRTIRRGLQLITQTFKESIQAYAQVDDNINKTMSQLTSSTKIIQLSLGTVILPIIQAITPAVQSLSVGFANMANTINASMAKMQGLTTYTKINVKALQDYRKQLNKTSGALFDFDKFRALSSKKDDSSVFLEEAAVADLNKEVGVSVAKWTVVYNILHNIGNILKNIILLAGQIFEAISPWILVFTSAVDFVLRIARGLISVLEKTKLIYPIVGGILGYLTLMGATKFITWLKSGSLVAWIKNATTATASFGKNLLSVLSTTQAMAIGIGALVGSIAYFVQNLDKMNSVAKITIPVVAALAAALTGVAVARAAAAAGIAAPVQAGITAAALAGAITLAAGTAIAIGAKKYAKGASDIDGGAVFIAGEAGKTEMVYSGENGKANVANVQQMYQAEYMAVLQALKDYGAARGEMPQLQPASDTGIYQAAERGARKVGKTFGNV